MSNKLKQGISILYDMELNNYLMNRAINQLNNKISRLGIKKTFKEPVKKEVDTDIFGTIITFAVIGAIGGAIIGAIYGLITGHGFFGKVNGVWAGLIKCGLTLGIIGAVIGLGVGISEHSLTERKYEEQYYKDSKVYKLNLTNDSIRVKKELKQKQILIQQRDVLIKKKNDAILSLRKFYLTMDIDEKYRNIVVIGYMNELLRLGISTRLEGTDGLYYLIRNELRWDQLQYTLDEISSKLDTLIDKQRDIYSELINMNNKCDFIISATIKQTECLNTISENTQIAVYNSERISKELEYQNFMVAYNMF